MKRLMHLSISILCLSVSLLISFHLGVGSVDAKKPANHPFVFWAGSSGTLLTANGEAWQVAEPFWVRLYQFDPPVPVSEIDLWSPRKFVTKSGDGWILDNSVWQNRGPVPD